jgi:hypothetical protein
LAPDEPWLLFATLIWNMLGLPYPAFSFCFLSGLSIASRHSQVNQFPYGTSFSRNWHSDWKQECLQKNALERLSNFGTAFFACFDHGNEHSMCVKCWLVQNLNIPSLLKLRR